MNKSNIVIDVEMDQGRVPQQISWTASDTTANRDQQARAMMLSFWDGNEKTAMRIDLWTKDMMVDEMADFFYQTFMTMADTYQRATRHEELSTDIREFAREFYEKFRADQVKQSKA